jgi:hypothetical protein
MATYYRNKYRGRSGYRRTTTAKKTENKAPVVHTDPTSSRWQKLLKYYGSCISVENAGEITLYSSKEGVEFLQVPAMEKEWIASGKEKLEF